MMKFFRKHNKQLLAVFMVLLMIVFLGGGALDNLLAPSNDRVVAHSRLGDISLMDQRRAESATSILDRTGFNWRRPYFGLSEPLEPTDWIILAREAEQLGMAGDLASVQGILANRAAVDDAARRLRVKPDRILAAQAQYLAIQLTGLAVGRATTPSEAEILTAARNKLETVRIATVLLPAAAFIDEESEFLESEIEGQFQAHREREPGEGIEFGYYVSPTVKVQYVKIDPEIIARNLRAANLERKARAFFDEQRETNPVFRRPAEELAFERSPDFVGPREDKSPYLQWSEVEEEAIELVRKQEADAAASRIADWMVQYMAEPWHGVPRSDSRYKTAPENVAELGYYEKALTKVPRTIAYPQAISLGITGFFNQGEVNEVEEIGRANFRPRRGRWETLGTLAFRSEAVVPTIPDDKGVNVSDYLAMFQSCRYPLKDSDGKIFVFRIVEAREGHVPDSLDEVRERVLTDLRLLEAYKFAQAKGESLRSCGGALSLVDAYESEEELVELKETTAGRNSGYFDPPPFARSTNTEGSIGDPKDKRYLGGGIGMVANRVIEECFALTDSEEKTAVFELPDRALVMVVEWLEIQRADGIEFSEMREELNRRMSTARSQAVMKEWFTPDKLRARNAFEIATN